MKKAFVWLVLLAAVLCTACQPAATSQGGTTTTTAGSTGHYFKADPANGEAYNAAITAYDTFLSGNQPAAGSTGVSEIYIDQFTTVNGTDGIGAFALLDVNRDGIPELHTRSTHLDVFTFKNGKVVHLLTSPFSYLNATVKVTADGTVFGKQDERLFRGWNGHGKRSLGSGYRRLPCVGDRARSGDVDPLDGGKINKIKKRSGPMA